MLAEEEDDVIEESISVESEEDLAEKPDSAKSLAEAEVEDRGNRLSFVNIYGAQSSNPTPLIDLPAERASVGATQIQAHFRGFLARKREQHRREEQKRSARASQIQAGARGFLARKRAKEELLHVDGHGSNLPSRSPSKARAAANQSVDEEELLVQGHTLSIPSRRPLVHTQNEAELHDVPGFAEDRTEQVKKIQAGARGWQARKQAKAERANTDSRLQAQAREYEARRHSRAEMMHQLEEDMVHEQSLHHEPSCELRLDRFKKEESAIAKLTKIQAGARGHLARKRVRQAGGARGDGTRAIEELPDQANSTEDDIAKERKIQATGQKEMEMQKKLSEAEASKLARIQAGARGYLARKEAKKMQAQCTQPVGALQLDRNVSSRDSAHKTSGGNRGLPARRPLTKAQQSVAEHHTVDDELPALASFSDTDTAKIAKIQAGARGLLARKQTNALKAHHPKSRKAMDEAPPALSSFSDTDKSQVTKIQAGARGFLARKRASQLKARQTEASRKVDDDLPALSSFSQTDTARLTKIQAGARGLLARKQANKLKAQQPKAVNAAADELPALSDFSETDTAKIAKIQAGARGLLARKRTDQLKERRHAPDARFSKKAGSNDAELPDLARFSDEDTAKITRIQAGARGRLCRKQTSQLKGETVVHHSREAKLTEDDLPALSTFSEGDRAKVAKIQAGARGLLARKNLKAHRSKAMAAAQEELPDLSTFSESDTAKLAKIQAGARGLLARKQTNELKARQCHPVKKEQAQHRLSDADAAKLTKLQAGARGYLARKQAKKEKEAAQATQVQIPACNDIASTTAAKHPAEASASPRGHEHGTESEATPTLAALSPLPPQRPPGAPPRGRRPRSYVKPPPPLDPHEALSNEFLTKRAEKRLQSLLHASLHNVPTFYPRPPSTPPRVKLGTLSESARHGIMQLERLEVQAMLKKSAEQEHGQKQRLMVEAKLEEWHAQREAAKRAEEERKRSLQEEKERAAQEDKRRWKRRGELLSKRVAEWGADKAERDERSERETKAAADERKKKEVQKHKNHCKKLKNRLANWYEEQEKKRVAEQAEAREVLVAGTAHRKPLAPVSDSEPLVCNASSEALTRSDAGEPSPAVASGELTTEAAGSELAPEAGSELPSAAVRSETPPKAESPPGAVSSELPPEASSSDPPAWSLGSERPPGRLGSELQPEATSPEHPPGTASEAGSSQSPAGDSDVQS